MLAFSAIAIVIDYTEKVEDFVAKKVGEYIFRRKVSISNKNDDGDLGEFRNIDCEFFFREVQN
jgi:hypothetical protein